CRHPRLLELRRRVLIAGPRMSRLPALDELLADVRAAGAAGAWTDAHARLDAAAERFAGDPAFALASAEAALRVGRPSDARRWASAVAHAPLESLGAAARGRAANYAGAAALALGLLEEAEQAFAEA